MFQLKHFDLSKLLTSSAVLLSAALLSTPAAANKNEVTNLINIWLDHQKDAQNIPAIMAAIVKDDEVYWSGGFGYANLTTRIKANTNTLTNICSNSKVLTAVGIMTLVEKGKLTLETDIQEFLPEYSFTHKFADAGPITIRSLLSHTSGLPRDTHHGYWGAPDFNFPDKEELIKSLSIVSTKTPVGEAIAYSNIGMALLGAAIEKASGLSYKDYMETHVYGVLDMDSSVVEMQKNTYGKQHALGYSAEDRNRNRVPAGFFRTKTMQPVAGTSTTINDWSKFAMWQLADDNHKLMSPELKKQMTTVQTKVDGGWSRGLGFELNEDKKGQTWAMHGGMCPGFNSYMKFNMDKKQAFAVFTNANRVTAAAYVRGLTHIVNLAESPSALSGKEAAHSKQVNTKEYQGFYSPFPWNSEYYVSPWQDGIIAMYLPSESLNHAFEVYKPKSKDVFVKQVNGKLTDEEIRFIRDSSGKITHVHNGGNLHPKI